MMRTHRWILLPATLFILATGGTVTGGSVELSFNDDSARLIGGWKAAGGRLDMDAGWLYSDDKARGDLLHLGLHVAGSRELNGTGAIAAGVGGRLYGVDLDPSLEAYGVAVGGFVRWSTPFAPRLAFSGSLYVSPRVLSGGDADSYVEATVDVNYEVIDGAEFFAGYRRVELDLDPGPSAELDDTVHLGVRLKF